MAKLTREEVEKYFIEQGRPDADESWYDEFLNAGERQPLYDEVVRNNYDLSDVDRWFHLMQVMGVDLKWETAMAINTALWEQDIEALELNTPEERQRIIQREEGSYLGDLQHVEEQIITEYEAGDVELAQFLLSKAPDLDIEDTFELYAKLRDRIDGDKVLYLKSSGEMYDIGAGEILTDYEMKNLISKYVQLDELEEGFWEDEPQESPEISALRGNISNLRKELDSVYLYEPDYAPTLEKILAVQELQLAAALEGVTIHLDSDDIIDAEHLDCFWYGGPIGTLEYKGYTVSVEVHGDVSATVLAEDGTTELLYYKNRNNSGAFGNSDVLDTIKNDETLYKLYETGRLVFSNNNWIEFLIHNGNEIVGPTVLDNVLDTNNVLEAFADVGLYKNIIDELALQKSTEGKETLSSDSVFIFDDELMINDDMQSINGYLWATDELVERMQAGVQAQHSPDVLETFDNINFYAFYNLQTNAIKVEGTYYYDDGVDEKQGCFDLPLSEEDRKVLASAFEAYCQNHHSQSCLEFVNNLRADDHLPELKTKTSPVSLSEQICSANMLKNEQTDKSDDTKKGPVR